MPAPIVVGDTSGLAQGISTAGSALGSALMQRGMMKQQQEQLDKDRLRKTQENQKYGTILQSTLGSLPENASPMQLTQALTSAVAQGVPAEMANQYGTLYSTLSKTNQTKYAGPEEIDRMSKLFQGFGMNPEAAERTASLWGYATVGGQTEIAKYIVDQIARNQFLPPGQQMNLEQLGQKPPMAGQPAPQFGQNQEQPLEAQVDISDQISTPSGQISEQAEFQFPEVDVFEDRTPKERASLKSELLKSNNKEYADVSDSLRGANREMVRLDQLSRLNESGKLPQGFGRMNVNWTTGDILIPSLATPEAQLFVKTVNDFTTTAKDTYGARVTNFELGAFMKRLPTLANSEEGRRVILEQMKAVKELDALYDRSIKQVYDHYGMQRIDRATAERIAEKMRQPQEERLMKRFEQATQAQDVYEARSMAPEGKIPARDPDGNIVYIWRNKADVAEKKGYKPL